MSLAALSSELPLGEFQRVWPLLEPAVEHWGTHTKESVWKALSKNARLLTTPDSAVVAEIIKYPSGLRVVNAWLGGGNLDEIREEIYPKVLDLGRDFCCHQARMNGGRPGWGRALGVRELGRIFVRDL